MGNQFYRLRRGRVLAGVLAGLADKYNWDLSLVRILFVVSCLFTKFPLVIYIVLAILLPCREDIEQGPFSSQKRRRKDAKPADDKEDGWYW